MQTVLTNYLQKHKKMQIRLVIEPETTTYLYISGKSKLMIVSLQN